MFCFQCEQTAQQTGCTAMGVCGKDPETAALQDLLVYAAQGISIYANRARALGHIDPEVDAFTYFALFTTVTNVNFDPHRMQEVLRQAADMRDRIRTGYGKACAAAGKEPEEVFGPAAWSPAPTLEMLIEQGEQVGIERRQQLLGHDILSLQELLLYGLKGMTAYAHHALVLGVDDAGVAGFVHDCLDYLATGKPSADELLARNLKCGEVTVTVLDMLDRANTGAYGSPEPTAVRIDPVQGKCILVTGHDLRDLQSLLEQTAGMGINIYTHGEMLPAHGYPALKKFPHLAGNFGGGWQDQREEFDLFPGGILVTTNCIQKPKSTYINRMFTCGPVAWPGVVHIPNRDFSPVIRAAQSAAGFEKDGPGKTIAVGFGHAAVMGVADKIIEAVKAGHIRRFFLMGGCDGARPGRNYYTEFAEAVPKDCAILTLGCAKYRFNKLDLGDIGGIPRLLDCGQCNDSYSAIRIAQSLAGAFGCGINELPLSLNVSWFEQKAVAVLLALLHLGVRNIRLGPTLPAFVSPNILRVLVEKFNIMPIKNVEEDLAACLAGK